MNLQELIGRQIGSYRVDSRLGEGGMGTVYRGTDTRLNRPVAIKVLSDELADAAARRRFQREAEMASALNHPHILTVYDAGEMEGRQYIVTEFVDGGTLKDWAAASEHTPSQIVELLTGVADGLATAHVAGILHRDIKPANILVASNGYAKLADFGLAKLEERSDPAMPTRTITEGVTGPGIVVGTVAYMSPEQAAGRPLDARSDIFSFGVLLYEMLAGRRPFSAVSELELLKTIVHGQAAPLAPEVPPTLSAVVEKALEKDPAERYQSMREVVVDLKRFSRRKQEATVPAPATTPFRWGIAAAGAAAAALAAIVWIARAPSAAPENPLANAQFTRLTDFEGVETDAAISRDGKWVAFRSDRDGPLDVFVSQVGSGRFSNLTNGKFRPGLVRNVGFSPDGSDLWLPGIIGGERLSVMPLTGGVSRAFLAEHAANLGWSRDGSKIAFHLYDTGDAMFACDSTGSNPKQIYKLGAGGHNHFPTWSFDDDWIYFVSGMWDAKEMDIWRIRPSGETAERLTSQNTDIRFLTLLDRRTLLYTAPDQNGGGPWLWAFDTDRKTARRVSSGLERYTSVEASADGRRLAVSVSNPSANLWSLPIVDGLAKEQDVKPFRLPVVRAYAPRFAGNSLFYLSSRGGGDGLWRFDGSQSSEIWRGTDGALFEPAAVSPDRRHVTIILRKNGRRTLTTLSTEGGEVRPVSESIDVSSAAGWSPDGRWLVAAGSDGKAPGLFKIPVEGSEPVRLTSGPAANPLWSPDGSMIVYTGPIVGITGRLLVVRPDGTPVEMPPISVRTGGERYRFMPGKHQLVYMPGSQIVAADEFWLLDLSTRKTHQLTEFGVRGTRSFDITPDGKQIVFDRLRENSDIVLIDLPPRQK